MSGDLNRPSDTERTDWLVRYQPWLTLLARVEIDSRFHGKFSESDAVQQTLMEAWQDWDNFRGENEQQRLAWLRKILAHQLAHLARHFAGTQKRNVAREVSIEHSLAQSSMRLDAMLVAPTRSPADSLDQREQQLALAATLERLPADYRDVLVMRHLEDLTHAEVADRMGRSVGAVRMLWVRALAQLREIVE